MCQEAHCPNWFECFSRGTATFLILGNRCTRRCAFCAVPGGGPEPPDPEEPRRIAEAVHVLGLWYTVITSVSRDDLPDGGASQFARVVGAVREQNPGAQLELLVPDFGGDADALQTVLAARPNVINHNLETVPRLYARIRPQADYHRSLELLRRAKRYGEATIIKSGVMVGLGETANELSCVLEDLADAGCDIVTLGQYLPPSPGHAPLEEYVSPERFGGYAEAARRAGIPVAVSGPFIRSSFRAREAYEAALQKRKGKG